MKRRDIKFRGYDPYGKYDETQGQNVGAWMSPIDFYNHPVVGVMMIPTYGDRYIWQQFTGLHDGENKEIYEGDILEFIHKQDCVFGPEGKTFAVVQYSEPDAAFIYVNNSTRRFLAMEWGNSLVKVRVIGNILDNPELIPVK